MKHVYSDKVDLWADHRELIDKVADLGQQATIDRAMKVLTPWETGLLLRRTFEKMTWSELAYEYNTPRSTLQRRHERILDRLRRELT